MSKNYVSAYRLRMYFSVPGKPVTVAEFQEFWESLNYDEWGYYHYVDLNQFPNKGWLGLRDDLSLEDEWSWTRWNEIDNRCPDHPDVTQQWIDDILTCPRCSNDSGSV